MRSGEAHVLEDGCTISMSRSLLKLALAATNFSGERCHGRAKTGQPSMTM